MPSSRKSSWASASSLTALISVVGCQTVNPTADYVRTSEVVREHTGSAAVYEPDANASVDEKVAALLADGLTVDEAIRVALLNNQGFHAAFHEIGASRADLV